MGSLNYVVSAPGKVILFGEHSVVYKKAAVSTSINRRLSVKVSDSKECKVFVKFPQVNILVEANIDIFKKVLKKKCPLKNIATELRLDNPDFIDHSTYVESLKSDLIHLDVDTNVLDGKSEAAIIGFMFVMRGMCQVFDCVDLLVPFSLEVTSELEVGAGTGSSAAFAVAISGSLLHYMKYLNCNQISSRPVPNVSDNIVIKSFTTKSGFSLEELQIINKWAFCIEKIMHGSPSGIDNTTCTFGSVVVTSQDKSPSGQLNFQFLQNVPKITILLISTGVSRNTSNLVMKVKRLREGNQAAVDGILNAMDTIALEASKTLEASATDKPCVELYKVLSGLMFLNHGLLRTLDVSHESLERIVSMTNHYGLTSKLTGAGGGGYAITLVPPNFPETQLEELKKELGQAFKVTKISIAEEGVRLEK